MIPRYVIAILAGLLALSAGPRADAQSVVVQTGSSTPRHMAMWATNGVIMDAGTSAGGAAGVNPTTLGITNTGTPFCITDVATTSPYHQLCFGASSLGGGLLSYNAFNGASSLPLQFNVNGVTFTPGPGVPTPVINGDCLIGVGGAAVWGSCSGAGTAVTSVTGTTGQVTASPTTGAVIVGLPATITPNETFSGAIAFTGSISGGALTAYLAAPAAIGGTTPAAGSFTTLSATGNLTTNITGSTQCLQANSSGVVSGAGAGCGTAGVTSVTGTGGQINVSPTTGAVVVSLPSTITSNETFSGTVNVTGSLQIGGTTVSLPLSVPNGGTGLSTLTSNVIYKGNASSALAASALTDNGAVVSSSESYDATSNGYLTEISNDTTTGTTANKLAKLTTSGKAIIAATTDTDNAVGVVTGGAGASGTAQIAFGGQASCVFDGATTAGDYVSISSTTGGDCHDAGASRPLGSQSIGRVLTTNVGAGTYAVALALGTTNTAGGGSGTVNSGTAGQLAYYASSTNAVSGNTNANMSSGALTLGIANSSLGSLILEGSTSGAVTIQPQAAAGTYNFNLPTTAGTSGFVLTSAGGGSAAETWTSPTITIAGQSCTLGSSCSIGVGNLSNIAGGTVVGNNTTTLGAPAASSAPVLGINGTTAGTLALATSTASGASVTLQNTSTTSAWNFNFPTGAGTSGQPLLSGGGGSTAQTYGTVGVPAGGTGDTTLTAHGVLFGEGTAAIVASAAGTSGIPLIGQGGSDPIFGTAVVAGGGTGDTTLTAHGVLLGEGTSAIVATAVGTNGQLFLGATAADPTWQTMSGDSTITAAGVVSSAGSALFVKAAFIETNYGGI